METCLPHPRFPCLKPKFQPWDEHKLLGSCGCEGSESCWNIITRLFWKAEQKYCITCCKQHLRILVLRNVGVFSQQATVFPSLRFSLRKGSLCPDSGLLRSCHGSYFMYRPTKQFSLLYRSHKLAQAGLDPCLRWTLTHWCGMVSKVSVRRSSGLW